MAKELLPLDITDTPELVRLAEEVAQTGTARLLRRNQENLAILSPAPRHTRRRFRSKSDSDLAALRSAAGAWSDLDLERFLADLAESRRLARPRAEL
jgi:hypothetical protein